MARRLGKTAAKTAATASTENSPPMTDEVKDETIQDTYSSNVATPQPLDTNSNVDECMEDESQSPKAESEAASPATTPISEPVVRKKKLGRPLKHQPSDVDKQDGNTSIPDSGTPAKGRGRGRGGFGRGGGRWARRGGPSHVTQQPVDKEGNMMDVVNDEVELPEDAEGEKKVDKFGHLQGGREYRCRTFTVLGRGQRLYMLSTEPARCVGFRDSYLFFTKHKRLYKIIIDEDEKRDLIERELIPHSYKGRAIGIVTARSVFREFGAQIIVGGRRITDDYEVSRSRADRIQEGELADPTDIIRVGEEYNKNQYVAWHGASSVYHSGAPTVPMPAGRVVDGKKKKIMINDVNWMLEHAREASRFNAKIGALRRQNLNGIYDQHTNLVMFPRTKQPTHAKWVQINDEENGIEISRNDQPQSDRAAGSDPASDLVRGAKSSIFTPVPPIYSKNLMIIDTVYESAPASFSNYLDSDNDLIDFGFNGLSSIPEDIKSELPPECLKALEETLQHENEWKSKWGPESVCGHRRPPIINKGVV